MTEQHDAIIEQIKEMGFDAVEVPIFDTADLAPFERLGKRLKALGLGATAVTVMGAENNPISPDPKIRDAAVAHLDRVMECGQAFGCEILCGPIHSAIGVFSNEAPTEDEFKHGVDTLRRPPRRPRPAASGWRSSTSTASRSISSPRPPRRRGSSARSIIRTAR